MKPSKELITSWIYALCVCRIRVFKIDTVNMTSSDSEYIVSQCATFMWCVMLPIARISSTALFASLSHSDYGWCVNHSDWLYLWRVSLNCVSTIRAAESMSVCVTIRYSVIE